MKVEKSKSKSKAKAKEAKKPKMTAEQKQCLAACKSFDADVERADYIQDISSCVMRERCKNCTKAKDCAGGSIVCRMMSIASVAVGMVMEGGAK